MNYKNCLTKKNNLKKNHTAFTFYLNIMCVLLFSVWLATQNHSTLVTDTTVVPFLPVNPEYSSTRNQASACTLCPHVITSLLCVRLVDLVNGLVLIYLFSQGRQKLARFSAHEFATLVIDILTDAKRRQWGNSCESPKGRT